MTQAQQPTLDTLYGALLAHPRTCRFELSVSGLPESPLWRAEVVVSTRGLRDPEVRPWVVFAQMSTVSQIDAVLGVIGGIDSYLRRYDAS